MPQEPLQPSEVNTPDTDIAKIPPTGSAGDVVPLQGHQQKIFIIALVVALSAILIGLLLWYKAGNVTAPTPAPLRPTAEMNNEPESTTAEAQTESFGAMSTSDELGAIEADLESTNLDSLESELIQIETELNAALQ